MSVFDSPHFDDHEEVVFVTDPRAGLRAIIAIHSTAPYGMSGGGCRMWDYPNDQAAIDDVLKLSKAMTYKLALADLPAGGAKMVILGDSRRDKTEALLEAVGAAVHGLRGRFVVGTDVGTSAADIEVMARKTPYVSRHAEEIQDSALATAYGVFLSIRWATDWHIGRDDLAGLRVAIQGVGRVGFYLGRFLRDAGATLIVTDVDEPSVARAVAELGAEAVAPDAIYDADVDVYAPCALGGVVSPDTVPRLRCKLVAGAANNPLSAPEMADRLEERGILFVPDFVANLGGVIGASPQSAGDDAMAFLKPVEKVVDVLDEVYELGKEEGTSLHVAAETLARRRVAARTPDR